MLRSRGLWIGWGIATIGLALYLGNALQGEHRTAFLPGRTTDGHYQIEIVCEACHVGPFTDVNRMQSACEACHAEALEEARDAHPRSKFTDPRNAERVARLDARYCTTCHVEHRPERTRAMGLTLPEDYCVLCHADIGSERTSHVDMSFGTCASAGCHNFHDNRALYEAFVIKHAAEPDLLGEPVVAARNFASIAARLDTYPADRYPLVPLGTADRDAPLESTADPELLSSWSTTAHAGAGVNCTACHVGPDGTWREHPGYTACRTCHAEETAGFSQSRHGMRQDHLRLGRALPPMRVADARLPMKPAAADAHVDCGSCHAAHRFDTRHAAVDACLACHDDMHSRAYLGSTHHVLWQRELADELPPGSGVTCASCHMPRVARSYDWGAFVHVLVQHNQSDNLRPNDKMLRTGCMQCHGYGFSVHALADRSLISSNFTGSPGITVQSIELAERRRRQVELDREASRRAIAQ